MNSRFICIPPLFASFALTLIGCTGSDDPHMAATLNYNSNMVACKKAATVNETTEPQLGVARASDSEFRFQTSPAAFIKCINREGWTLVVAADGRNLNWTRPKSETPLNQNPDGNCKLAYNEILRDTLVVPTIRDRTVTGLLWIAGTWIKFSPDYYQLDHPAITQQRGWTTLIFTPKADATAWPNLIINIDSCKKTVIREALRYSI